MVKKVLFINKTNPASIIPELLSAMGEEVAEVYDAGAGFQLLQSQVYDLIILKENPAVESWTFCAKIRQQTSSPLMVISCGASAESCVNAINAGVDSFIRKPFGPMELMARVNLLLQRLLSRQPVSSIS